MRLLLLLLTLLLPVSTQAQAWVSLGMPAGGVDVRALHAGSDGYLYAATSLGIFRMREGEGWRPFSRGFMTDDVRSFFETSSGMMYVGAGTGMYARSLRDTTWYTFGFGLPFNTPIHTFGYDTNTFRLYAGTSQGVYLSWDNGVNWDLVPVHNRPLRYTAVAADGRYVFVGSDRGLFRSENSGGRWDSTALGLPTLPVSAIRMNSPQFLTVGLQRSDTQPGGLYQSFSAGANWAPMSAPPELVSVYSLLSLPNGGLMAGGNGATFLTTNGGQSWTRGQLPTGRIPALARLSNGTLYAGTSGYGVYRSTNQGLTWNPANLNLSSEVSSVAEDGIGRLWAATAGGVFVRDAQSMWDRLDQGFFSPRVNAVGVNRVGQVFAGTQDGLWILNEPLRRWERLSMPGQRPVYHIARDPNVNALYLGTNNGVSIYLNGSFVDSPIQTEEGNAARIHRLLATPMGHLYAASEDRLYRIQDDGNGWRQVSRVDTVRAMAFRTFDNALFVGFRDGRVGRSYDGGATFTMFEDTTETRAQDIRDILILPDNPGAVLIASRTWGVKQLFDILMDPRDRWIDLSATLPDPRVIALNLLPDGSPVATTVTGGVLQWDASATVSTRDDEMGAEPRLDAFPNPATTHITVRTNLPNATRLGVYDALGREVAHIHVAAGAQETSLPVASLPPGVYVLRTQGTIPLHRTFVRVP